MHTRTYDHRHHHDYFHAQRSEGNALKALDAQIRDPEVGPDALEDLRAKRGRRLKTIAETNSRLEVSKRERTSARLPRVSKTDCHGIIVLIHTTASIRMASSRTTMKAPLLEKEGILLLPVTHNNRAKLIECIHRIHPRAGGRREAGAVLCSQVGTVTRQRKTGVSSVLFASRASLMCMRVQHAPEYIYIPLSLARFHGQQTTVCFSFISTSSSTLGDRSVTILMLPLSSCPVDDGFLQK